MRKSLTLVLSAVLVMAFAAPVLAKAPATGITATPAASITWAGTYTATFVRSASGIINETDRVNSAGAQNGWTSFDVWLQFRPLTGPDGNGEPTPNPNCDPVGLVTTFVWHNDPVLDPAIAGTPSDGYFIGTNEYNVCVYLVPGQVVASGTIDSTAMNGTTATLPVSGNYRIDVSGTWLNTTHGWVDAQYNNGDNLANDFTFNQLGWPGIGDGWGRVLVNDTLISWGAFDAGHDYSYSLVAGSVKLNVFEGYTPAMTYVPAWYGDNVGSLSFTITTL